MSERKRFSPLLFRFLVLITLIGLAGGFLLARWFYTGSDVLRVKDIVGVVTSVHAETVCIQPRHGEVTCQHPVIDGHNGQQLPKMGAHVRAGFVYLPLSHGGARGGSWLYFDPLS